MARSEKDYFDQQFEHGGGPELPSSCKAVVFSAAEVRGRMQHVTATAEQVQAFALVEGGGWAGGAGRRDMTRVEGT